jgi:manganese transport protein
LTTAPPRRRSVTLSDLRARGRLRTAIGMLGPAFIASAAYVDPGNFATNFEAGAEHGYLLLWVVVLANLMAILVQYVASKAGLATGRSLPEICGERYGRRTNLVLWLQGEIVAMATDLAEFTGAAVGLHLLFGMALLPAGGVTACVAFAVLALDQRHYRRFELAIMAMLAMVAGGFAYLFLAAQPASPRLLADGLLPRLGGGDTVTLAVGIVGATVMPHVVYLHSALHKNRVTAESRSDQRALLSFNRLDCLAGLGSAGLVNFAMLCVAASLFHRPGLQEVSGLVEVHSRLAQLVGGGAALAFAVALLASGLSSSSVGTYAGQVIMAGFMNWRIPLFVRRALTMLPSLAVLAFADNVSQALIYSQVVLSFGIPFALIPLLAVSRDRSVLGAAVSHRWTTALLALVIGVILALNAFLICQVFAGLVA